MVNVSNISEEPCFGLHRSADWIQMASRATFRVDWGVVNELFVPIAAHLFFSLLLEGPIYREPIRNNERRN